MSLEKISIKNFKLIKEVTIYPGKINQIVGENNNGKTTVLEAIQFAMVGSTDKSLITHGEDKATVELIFTDGLVVLRMLSKEAGQTLKVELNDMSPQRPQSYLNGLVGVGTFNPKEVLDPKKRTEYLMKVINVKVQKCQIESIAGEHDIPDFNYDEHGLKVIERVSQYFYDARAVQNKAHKKAVSEVEVYQKDLPEDPGSPKHEGSDEDMKQAIEAFKQDFESLQSKQDEWDKQNNEVQNNAKEIDTLVNEMEELRTQIKHKCGQADAYRRVNREIIENRGEKPDIIKEAEAITHNIDGVREEINLRKEIGSFEREKMFIDKLKNTAWEIEVKAKSLGAVYKNISTNLVAELMSRAELPIEGLSYIDGKFKLDNIEVEQLSSSKALSLALAITKKLNKKCNLICIDGIELLDQKTYAALHAEMIKDEYNYFMTKVGRPFEVNIPFEDIEKRMNTVIDMIDGGASAKDIINETNKPFTFSEGNKGEHNDQHDNT